MNTQDYTGALRDFSKLSARDRMAVVKHLSPEERKRLLALEQRRPKPRPAVETNAAFDIWPAYSPWLAKHLARLLGEAEAGQSRLTPAAQSALHAALSNPRVGP